jgi:hypothetical protein
LPMAIAASVASLATANAAWARMVVARFGRGPASAAMIAAVISSGLRGRRWPVGRLLGAPVPGDLTAGAMVTAGCIGPPEQRAISRALEGSPSAAHRHSSEPIPGASANAAGHSLA